MSVFLDVVKALLTIPPRAPFNGAPTPSWGTGIMRGPNWVLDDATALTTTATRLYYYPMFFDRAEALAGALTLNTGAGDNGETYRTGLYFDNGPNGGVAGATLAVDFGQVTLTAASALRTSATPYQLPSPGWYWLAVHHNTACSMAAYEAPTSEVIVNFACRNIGTIAANSEWQGGSLVPFLYVDTAYGALASTAVAPTAATNIATAVRLYK
jgi:hypothetical protein